MKRGDIILVAASGDYGKPRPSVVVQSDILYTTNSILVALMTSDVVDAPLYRLTLHPNPQNGLKLVTQVMADKIVAMPRDKCGRKIGRIDDGSQVSLNHLLSVIFGLAE